MSFIFKSASLVPCFGGYVSYGLCIVRGGRSWCPLLVSTSRNDGVAVVDVLDSSGSVLFFLIARIDRLEGCLGGVVLDNQKK